MINFVPKINTFYLFSKSVHWVFLKLYLIAGIKKWAKVIALDFQEKLILSSK